MANYTHLSRGEISRRAVLQKVSRLNCGVEFTQAMENRQRETLTSARLSGVEETEAPAL